MAGMVNTIPLFYTVAGPHHFAVVSHEHMSASCMCIACIVVCLCVLQVRTESYLNRPSIEKYFSSSQSSESQSTSSSVLVSASPPVHTGSTHQFCSLRFSYNVIELPRGAVCLAELEVKSSEKL